MLGLGAFFVLSGSGGEGGKAGAPAVTISMEDVASTDVDPESEEPLTRLASSPDAAARTEAEVALEPVSAGIGSVASLATRNIDASTAKRVTVEIVWPAGTPASMSEDSPNRLIAWSDEEVDENNFDWTSESFRRRRQRRSTGQAALGSLEQRESDDEVRFDVVTLEDGISRVEVLFDQDAQQGRLQIASKYLYLTEAPTVDLTGEMTVFRLEPQLGAWISGSVRTGGAEVAAGADGSFGKVSLTGGSMGRGRGGRGNGVNQSVDIKEDLTFEFYGINPSLVVRVAADIPAMAPMTSEILELTAGVKTLCNVQVQRGGSMAGRVLDLTGQALEGVKVSASKSGGMFGGGGARREATSDAEGRFLIAGLEVASYRPTAELEGWRNWRADEAIEVAENARVTDVQVNMDPGREILGRVLTPEGAPAAGASVRLSQSPPAAAGGGGGMGWGRQRDRSERKDMVTDAQGKFRFVALAKTPAQLTATLEPDVEGAPLLAASAAKVEPADRGEARPIEIRLSPTVAISGRVANDRGEPITAFSVRATREGVSGRAGPGDSAREAFDDLKDGAFTLQGATEGTWRVSVSAEGHDSPEEQTRTVTLPQQGPELQFTLIRQGAIRGVVVDPNGIPVAGATVQRETGGFGFGRRGGGGVTTEADGTFEIEELSPGSQILFAKSDDWAASEKTTIEVVGGVDMEGAVLSLRRGGTVTGVVRDDGGNPWAGRRVSYATGSGPVAMFAGESTTDTDASGRFRFEHVAPGKWIVNASPGEREMMETMQSGDRQAAFFELMGKNLTAEVMVVDGEEVSVELGAEARDPVVVFGQVTRNGEAVTTGNVTFAREGKDLFANLKRTDVGAEGSYRVELDRPGAYVVSVERGQRRNQFLIDVVSGGEQRADLSLPEGGIAGRVRDSEGDAAVGVRVSVEPVSSAAFSRFNQQSTSTDENGLYEILELDPGSYTVRFGGRGFGRGGGQSTDQSFGRAVMNSVQVTASEVTAGVNIQVEGAGRITGIVLDLQGDPVTGATIFVRDGSGRTIDSISTTRTGASGRFTYSEIAPGTYSVSAQTDSNAAPDVGGVVVREAEDAEVSLQMSQGSVLVVTTVDDEGEAVRAQLSVLDEEGREMTGLVGASAFRNFRGGVSTTEQRVGPLTPGRYTVLATAQDGRTQKKRVTVRDKEETKVRVKFKN